MGNSSEESDPIQFKKKKRDVSSHLDNKKKRRT